MATTSVVCAECGNKIVDNFYVRSTRRHRRSTFYGMCRGCVEELSRKEADAEAVVDSVNLGWARAR